MAQTDNKCGKGKTANAIAPTANKNMSNNANNQTKFDRLPDGVNLTDQVRKDATNDKGEVVSTSTTTVEAELKELGAKYANDKLIDRTGREIRFYTPPVRGISQGFEEDERQRKEDEKEFAELKKKYTVIVLYVAPRQVL
jgi:hypothetical protein